jgi:hypothetical protein
MVATFVALVMLLPTGAPAPVGRPGYNGGAASTAPPIRPRHDRPSRGRSGYGPSRDKSAPRLSRIASISGL